jgi:hypothetical protein
MARLENAALDQAYSLHLEVVARIGLTQSRPVVLTLATVFVLGFGVEVVLVSLFVP